MNAKFAHSTEMHGLSMCLRDRKVYQEEMKKQGASKIWVWLQLEILR